MCCSSLDASFDELFDDSPLLNSFFKTAWFFDTRDYTVARLSQKGILIRGIYWRGDFDVVIPILLRKDSNLALFVDTTQPNLRMTLVMKPRKMLSTINPLRTSSSLAVVTRFFIGAGEVGGEAVKHEPLWTEFTEDSGNSAACCVSRHVSMSYGERMSILAR